MSSTGSLLKDETDKLRRDGFAPDRHRRRRDLLLKEASGRFLRSYAHRFGVEDERAPTLRADGWETVELLHHGIGPSLHLGDNGVEVGRGRTAASSDVPHCISVSFRAYGGSRIGPKPGGEAPRR
jgi:hypothetical protein